MIIDSFTSFGIWPRRGIEISAKGLADNLKKSSIDRACSISTEGIFYDFIEGNNETLRECKENNALIPIATVNPAVYFNCYSEIERCLNFGFKLFAFFPEYQEWHINGFVFDKILSILSGSSVVLYIPASEDITRIASITGGMDNAVIIHSFRYCDLAEAIEALNRYKNLYIETHMINSPDYIEVLRDEVGLERVIFGSNAPATCISSALLPIHNAEVDDKDKEKILSGNISRLLRGENHEVY